MGLTLCWVEFGVQNSSFGDGFRGHQGLGFICFRVQSVGRWGSLLCSMGTEKPSQPAGIGLQGCGSNILKS